MAFKGRGKSMLVSLASFGVLMLVAFGSPDVRRGQTDFRSFYAGARLVGTPHLYSLEDVYRIEREDSPNQEIKAYTRPPFYALLLWPLGRLPYKTAHTVWQLLNLAALAGFLYLWSPNALAVALCCFYFPSWVNFMVGQDAPLVLLSLSLSAFLLKRGKDLPAGMVLSFCSVKFHLFLLIPLLIAGKKLWRFGAGLASGGAALLAVSYATAGRTWLGELARILRLNERGEASQSYMPNLNGLLHTLPYGTVWLILGTVAVVCATWYVVRRSPVQHAFAAVLCGGLLIGLHAFLYDCVFLLPFFLSYASRAGYSKALGLSMATGMAAVALANPAISFIGQFAVILVFIFVVYDAYQREHWDTSPSGAGA